MDREKRWADTWHHTLSYWGTEQKIICEGPKLKKEQVVKGYGSFRRQSLEGKRW